MTGNINIHGITGIDLKEVKDIADNALKLAESSKDFPDHKADTVMHTSAEERAKWNGKAEGVHAHKASEVTFTDGQDFQQKLDSGTLRGAKGDKGDKGDPGPQGPKGADGVSGGAGAAAGFGTVSATVDSGTGTPSVTVSTSGSDTAKNFTFSFKNLKGATGAQGPKGDTGARGATGPQGPKGADGTFPVDNPEFTGSISMGRLPESQASVGSNSVALGYNVQAVRPYACALGEGTNAGGRGSLTAGYNTRASGDYSCAIGKGTIANITAAFACGKFNQNATNGTGLMFVGYGDSDTSRSNAMKVTTYGDVFALSGFYGSGADYAEYFEWADGNPDGEDRVGYFVTMKGKEIQIANPGDYILGIVSGQPCVIGNGDEDWLGRWLHDEFGRFIRTKVEIPVTELVEVPGGGFQEVETGEVTYEWRNVVNPEYDSTRQYIERRDRKEWSAVGMMGVLSVRDDGTCQVDGFCKVAEGGTATAAEKYICGETYRVIERMTGNVVKVVFRN